MLRTVKITCETTQVQLNTRSVLNAQPTRGPHNMSFVTADANKLFLQRKLTLDTFLNTNVNVLMLIKF